MDTLKTREFLNTFHRNLLYYKRYIDDIFGIWVDLPETTWEDFKQTLAQFGQLCWNLEDCTTSTNFLDLQINIINDINDKIQTTTFQKELNLYLYIPPTSAHPSSCFKGLITGELVRLLDSKYSRKRFYTHYSTIHPMFNTKGTPHRRYNPNSPLCSCQY
jgi:hypothetical protein